MCHWDKVIIGHIILSISDEDDNISGILEYFPINNKMCSLSSDVQYARWSSCVSAFLHTKPILLHNIFLSVCFFAFIYPASLFLKISLPPPPLKVLRDG